MVPRGTLRNRSVSLCLGVVLLLLSPGANAARAPMLGPPDHASEPPAVLPGDRDGWWDEPPDLNGLAMTSEIISVYSLESEIANDFYSSSPTTIFETVWWGEYFNGQGEPNVSAFNLRFYEDGGGVPGSLVAEYLETIPTETIALGQGQDGPIYEYHAFVMVDVGEGPYWFSAQACDHEFPPQWGRLATGEVTGNQAMFRSAYLGYPDWTSSEDVCGTALDMSQRFYTIPPVAGACCFPDLHCETVGEPYCDQLGGAWQGPGTSCDPDPCPSVPMACCFPDAHCEQLSQAACDEAGGSSGIGPACDPNPCPVTCCFLDGHCESTTEGACRSEGGNPLGFPSSCDPNPCPRYGACCSPATGICTLMTEDQCTPPGIWMGEGTFCDPNPCPQPPTGACCNPSTGSCRVTTQVNCTHDWQGEFTTCTPNPCPQPPGVSLYYVRSDGSGDSPPYFPTIQAAIDYANLADGDVIELIGTEFSGEGNSNVNFNGRLVTIRSQGGDPDQCFTGRFVFDSGEDNRAVLEGITIRLRYLEFGSGGGISIHASSPWIRGCKIVDCSVDHTGAGGGVYCGNFSAPLFTDCTISGCEAGSDRYPAARGGAGVYSDASSILTMRDCVVTDNYLRGQDGATGGGVSCYRGDISGCTITSNRAVDEAIGGGIYCETGLISNCEIRGNLVVGSGGGVAGGPGELTLENCVITGNAVDGPGGAVSGADLTITNCTIAGNASWGVHSDGDVQLLRSIIWGNVVWDAEGSGMVFTCCATDPTRLSGEYTFNGDQVFTDPSFCGPGTGDLTLRSGSPCLAWNSPCDLLIGALGLGCPVSAMDGRSDDAAIGLLPADPNPVTASTAIAFSIAREGVIDLAIYDVSGRCVRRLASHVRLAAGVHSVIWNRADDAGRILPSGVYVCRLRMGGVVQSNRLVLLR